MFNKIIKIPFIIVINICLSQSLEDSTNLSINDAISKYKKLSEENPNQKEIDYNLGNLNYYKGEFEKAISYYNDALKTNNNELKSNSHFNLGNTYYSIDDFEKSLSEYKKSLELNPNNDDARYNFEFVKKIMQKREEEQQESEQGSDKNQGEGEEEQMDNNKKLSAEEILEKEEAEAILNSLKANQNNLMRRKYKPIKPIKVLKDW